jgi:predicted TIM-barrel fold metal-dependent hydrolase
MILDASAYVGHWPFRAMPFHTVDDLLRQMDGHGIDMAVVSSINAMFYQDPHEANRELARDTRRRRDRLVTFATLNPAYPGWEDDLKQCRGEFGMAGLRLIPQYHGYRLGEPCAEKIVHAAAACGMVVSFSGRIVDRRYRHRMDEPWEVTEEEVLSLFRRTREARYLLVNFYSVPGNRRWDRPAVWLDTCRLRGVPGGTLAKVIETCGADRVVLGTSMLFRYAAPALLALQLVDAPRSVKERVSWRNLAALLKMRPAAGG